MKYSNKTIKQGDIYYVNLGKEKNGHVQNGGYTGERPCIIIGNQKSCDVSPVLLVVPITSSEKKVEKELPTHMKMGNLLKKNSVATFEQIHTVNRYQIGDKVASLTPKMMLTAHRKLQISLGMTF